MFAKTLFLIVVGTAMGTALLGLRQRQLELAHTNAVLHRQIDLSRQVLWNMQTRIARGTDPETLRRVVVETALPLEPVVARPGPPRKGPGMVDAAPASYRGHGVDVR